MISAELPHNLISVGERAFYGCSNMEGDLVLPGSLTQIEENAFAGCRISDTYILMSGSQWDLLNQTNLSQYGTIHTFINDEFEVEQNDSSIVLSWDNVPYAENYNIYYKLDDDSDEFFMTRTNGTRYSFAPQQTGEHCYTFYLCPTSNGFEGDRLERILTYSNTVIGPRFSGHSLVLSDEIGVRFKVLFPDNFDTQSCYVTFESSDGRISRVQYSDSISGHNANERYFVFYINALEIADTIKTTLFYGDGEDITDAYSAIEYIEYMQRNYSAYPNGEKILDLVNSLYDYSYYMQNSGWSDNGVHEILDNPVKTLESSDVEAARDAVQSYGLVTDLASSGIEDDIKVGLTLNTRTELRVSVRPTDGVTITSSGYTERQINGVTYYQFAVKNIGPKNLDYSYTINVSTSQGTAEISVSALYYLKAILNSNALTDNQVLALTAYYNYYLAAENY